MDRKLAKVKLHFYSVAIKFFGWLNIYVTHSEVCVTKNGQTVYYGSGHEGGHVGLPSAGQPLKISGLGIVITFSLRFQEKFQSIFGPFFRYSKIKIGILMYLWIFCPQFADRG